MIVIRSRTRPTGSKMDVLFLVFDDFRASGKRETLSEPTIIDK